MLITIALLTLGEYKNTGRNWRPSGPPEKMMAYGISAPVVPVQAAVNELIYRSHVFWGRGLTVAEIAAFALLTGILWYLVGHEIDARFWSDGKRLLPRQRLLASYGGPAAGPGRPGLRRDGARDVGGRPILDDNTQDNSCTPILLVGVFSNAR